MKEGREKTKESLAFIYPLGPFVDSQQIHDRFTKSRHYCVIRVRDTWWNACGEESSHFPALTITNRYGRRSIKQTITVLIKWLKFFVCFQFSSLSPTQLQELLSNFFPESSANMGSRTDRSQDASKAMSQKSFNIGPVRASSSEEEGASTEYLKGWHNPQSMQSRPLLSLRKFLAIQLVVFALYTLGLFVLLRKQSGSCKNAPGLMYCQYSRWLRLYD